jgi:transposase
MRWPDRRVTVFAYGVPTDMRKGFDGLCAVVRQRLERDVYLFVSRDRVRAKVLHFDGTDLCICAKRLERGRFASLWRAPREDPLRLTVSRADPASSAAGPRPACAPHVTDCGDSARAARRSAPVPRVRRRADRDGGSSRDIRPHHQHQGDLSGRAACPAKVSLRVQWRRRDRTGPRTAAPQWPLRAGVCGGVAVAKYADHLPLERLVRMMAREGLQVESQTLCDQIQALARYLEPTYEALGARALAAPVINVDETRWPRRGSSSPSTGTVWGVHAPAVSFYRILPGKSTDDGRQVLGGYRGTVVVDGFAVYEVLARDGPGFALAHCWAHTKRKYDEMPSTGRWPVQRSAD